MSGLDILRRWSSPSTIFAVEREDVEAIVWQLADIRDDTDAIRKSLEDETEEDGEDA
jgi:hypothetical protein